MSARAAAARDDILGAWRLISLDLFSDEESGSHLITQPLGPTPLGRAIFSPEGYVSFNLTDPDRTKPFIKKAVPWIVAEDEDIAFVSRPMIAYWGRFRVFEEEGDLRFGTQVEVALDPSWIGTEQVRRVSIREEDGKKILVLKPIEYVLLPNGIKGAGVLTWEKMERSDGKL